MRCASLRPHLPVKPPCTLASHPLPPTCAIAPPCVAALPLAMFCTTPTFTYRVIHRYPLSSPMAHPFPAPTAVCTCSAEHQHHQPDSCIHLPLPQVHTPVPPPAAPRSSVDADRISEYLYQWASTLTQSGANFPFALPLKADKEERGFKVGVGVGASRWGWA